jgi:micrococcal nuclease
MFGLRRLFRREVKKAVRSIVSAPTKSSPKVSRQTVITKEVVTKHTKTVSVISQTEIKTEQTTVSGKCHVIDGDTIAIGKQKIRLAGIDAPELNKPYGKQAKWKMVEICKGQNITAYLTGETSYDRVVAKCFLDDGRDIAEEIVKAGLALDIPHFPNADYKRYEPPGVRRKLRWRPKRQ